MLRRRGKERFIFGSVSFTLNKFSKKFSKLALIAATAFMGLGFASQTTKAANPTTVKVAKKVNHKKRVAKKAKKHVVKKAKKRAVKKHVSKRKISAKAAKSVKSNNMNINLHTITISSKSLNKVAKKKSSSTKRRYNLCSYANRYVGVRYVWGGTTPRGFDCSGFTQYVYRHEGKRIGRVTTQQEHAGKRIPLSKAKKGDLVFFGRPGASYHVGIYVGGGRFIHSPQPGQSVKYTSIRYYRPSFAVHVKL